MRYLIFILLTNFLVIRASAQLHVTGEIRHGGKGIDQAVIKVFEDDKLLRTVAATRKGHYEMDFTLGREYLLLFYRPYMIPVYIKIDTRVNREWNASEKVVELPLNMEMYQRFSGLDIEAYRQPIGVIQQSGNGANTFGFVSNNSITDDIRKINDESLARELSGENPIDGDNPPTESMPESKEPSVEIESNAQAKPVPIEDVVETITQRQADDYSATEKALDSKSESIKRETNVQEQVKTQREVEEKNFMSEQKKTRSEVAELEQQAEEEHVETMVRVHQKHEELMATAASDRPMKESIVSVKQIIPIARKNESGWFYNEELLTVSVSGKNLVFRKVVYDWILFESTLYYSEDKEIAAKEYEDIRKLFN